MSYKLENCSDCQWAVGIRLETETLTTDTPGRGLGGKGFFHFFVYKAR